MKPIIYPYKLGSHSARELAHALGTICIREQGMYVPKITHIIINWGNPRSPAWSASKFTQPKWLNKYNKLEVAQNKLSTFRVLSDNHISCPDWTTDINIAKKWLKAGSAIVQRNSLNSHSGGGINFVGYDEETSTPIGVLSPAPLYTRYKKKAQEFRVHVFNGEVIDVQEKKKINNFEGNFNQFIRSHDNGWVYCREDIQEPHDLQSLAIAAVGAVQLDFGAADIVYNKHENKSFCLEINTAPGLEGATINNYSKAIQKLCLQ